jgi:DNA-binding NarL/FixJ family response regulator
MITVGIIEDEPSLRKSLKDLINETEGLCCEHVFETAEEAIAHIPLLDLKVVLTDIHLPGMNGIDCISRLKHKCPDIQFLICTSFDDTETVFRALTFGASGYLTKTTPPQKVMEAIADVHQGGSPMNSHIARKVVASFQASHVRQHAELQKLSRREQEILDLLSEGLRYKEIAGKLFLSVQTVRTHIRNIYEKLQVNSRTEALRKTHSR